MFQYQNNVMSEVQRVINQLQQNERNNAQALRSIAAQLQTMSATEAQATAMLQQIQTLCSQLALDASRQVGMGYQPGTVYEPVRTNVGSSVAPSSTAYSPATGTISSHISQS